MTIPDHFWLTDLFGGTMPMQGMRLQDFVLGTSHPNVSYANSKRQFFCGVHDVPDCSSVDSAGRDRAASGHLPSCDPATGRLRLVSGDTKTDPPGDTKTDPLLNTC